MFAIIQTSGRQFRVEPGGTIEIGGMGHDKGAEVTFDQVLLVSQDAGEVMAGAPFVSGAQRLANGNTLVAAGTGGEIFEVTAAGEVVWEYRVPYWGEVVRNADGSLPQPRIDERPFSIFRATRIPADHPGLAGRTLAPLEPQPAWYDGSPE